MNFIYEAAPLISLLFFFCVFLWVAYNAYRPSQKAYLESLASIPLKEGSSDE